MTELLGQGLIGRGVDVTKDGQYVIQSTTWSRKDRNNLLKDMFKFLVELFRQLRKAIIYLTKDTK